MEFFDSRGACSGGEASGPDNEQFFTDPSWVLQDTPPYEPYDTAAIYPDDWKSGHQLLMEASDIPQPSLESSQTSPVPANGGLTAGFGPIGLPSIAQNHPNLPPGALNALTETQRQKLQKIAMPPHLQYHSPKSEPSPPESTECVRKSVSASPGDDGAPTEISLVSRKRKVSTGDDDDDDDDLEGGQPVKKTAHNMIEKRYRTNLNDKIAALRDSVPSLRIMSKSARGEDTTEDREELHGLTPAHKLNKATILSKATEYIRHLEKRNNRLMEENNAMQQRIAAFEKLFLAGAMNGGISPGVGQQSTTPGPYAPEASPYANSPMPTPGRSDPQGMIQVPEDMKRIIAAQMATAQPYPVPQQQFRPNPALVRQQQIQQQQQQAQAQRWGNAGPYFGKLMVGSLAGLMILESVREDERSAEEPDGRGLFAVPLQLLNHLMSYKNVNFMGYHITAAEVLFYLKVSLLLCSLLWAVYPSLTRRSSPPGLKVKQETNTQTSIQAAPSLASPIHVRRQAWLTAVQTVWVPRHNFFLEAAALLLKTAKLSLRNLVGASGYRMLTGLTEEQELARVKAWTIALDAQLAGGDVEISKSRLTLTLLASGTLPNTPLTLMMKALHIRVLLWETGFTGAFNAIASKLARSQWNEARQMYRLQTQLRRTGQEEIDNELPDHLAMLLEQDADEVLNATIIQRVHNLAWNRPSQQNAVGVTGGMDAVVDDVAVRSPLDAVASWWSTMTLHTALMDSILVQGDEDGELKQDVENGITMAIRIAPGGSIARNRALVARAVLSDLKRGTNIAAVMQAVNPPTASVADEKAEASESDVPEVDIPRSLAASEIYTSLQCAKVIAHLQRYTPPKEPTAIYPIIERDVRVTKDMTLLGFTAVFTLMERLAGHQLAAEACCDALERISGSLRIWISKECGLEPGLKQEMVERCLAVTRDMVGMDIESDTGYESMSESDDDEFLDSDSSLFDERSSIESVATEIAAQG